MDTKSNVNPNHYKTAGRERQGEDIVQAAHKKKFIRQPGGAGSEGRPPFPGAERTRRKSGGKARS